VIQSGNIIIYHSGDSDRIPEMQKLSGYGKKENTFIALLCIGGKFTMNADEAAEAASEMKASIAIPMHYGSIVGSPGDAIKFSELCKEKNIRAEILEKI
jgi:L-ascorbate metabolism protein UlaG (beta-lactamase superfamily)